MPLTEEMKKWNQRIEEERNKTEDLKYLEKFPKEIQEIYQELRTKILDLYPNTKIILRKNYISYKTKNNFLDIQPQKRMLKCVINIKKGILKDPKRITRDISNVGHFGSGDYEVSITSTDQIPEIIKLIYQSYNSSS